MEIADELGARQRRAGLGVVQLDRGAHGLDVVGVGRERLRPAVAPQRLDKGRKSTRVHRLSPVTCAARRSARCCNTFAFPTLMFIA